MKAEYRPLKDIDIESLKEDLRNSVLIKTPLDDLDSLISQFNETLGQILDKHAPKKTRTAKTRKNPLYNNEIHAHRQLRRKLTRVWRNTGSTKGLQGKPSSGCSF